MGKIDRETLNESDRASEVGPERESRDLEPSADTEAVYEPRSEAADEPRSDRAADTVDEQRAHAAADAAEKD
jgi:hypothetical protein